jgi:putative FmdB family regulatory protein
MPIYVYGCSECGTHFTVSHGMEETQACCESCESVDIRRVPTSFTNLSKRIEKVKKVGEMTKEFIESSREELSKQKQDLDNER